MPDFDDHDTNSRVLVKEKIQEPERYRVLLLNDDYTTMEFVITVLCKVFHKTPEQARDIMLLVHHQGVGMCGVYTKEVAEGKVRRVHTMARAANFPLKCVMELS